MCIKNPLMYSMHKFDQNISNKPSKPSIVKLAKLSAKITLRFGIVWREFIEYYKQFLVKEAKKLNPDYSIVELSGRTGIDRRHINYYLNVDEPCFRPSKIKLTLQYMKSMCEKNNSNCIPKSGPFQTFESICKTTASGTLTPKAIASELIRLGNIKEEGNYYQLVNWKYTTESDENYLAFLTNEMARMTDTTIENIDNTNDSNKKFQRNVYSSQICPEKFDLVHQEVDDLLFETHDKIYQILTSHEDDVPRNTCPTLGVSMFVFESD